MLEREEIHDIAEAYQHRASHVATTRRRSSVRGLGLSGLSISRASSTVSSPRSLEDSRAPSRVLSTPQIPVTIEE